MSELILWSTPTPHSSPQLMAPTEPTHTYENNHAWLAKIAISRMLELEHGTYNSLQHAAVLQIPHERLCSVLSALRAHGLIETIQYQNERVVLSWHGEQVLCHGSPEFLLWQSLPEKGWVTLEEGLPVCNVQGFAQAMQKQWIRWDKTTNTVSRNSDTSVDTDPVRQRLAAFDIGQRPFDDKQELELYKKRNLVRVEMTRWYSAFVLDKGRQHVA